MVEIVMEGQSHNTRPPLEADSKEVFFRQDLVFSADVLIVSVIRFNGDYLTISDVRFDDTMLVAAAVTTACSVYCFYRFIIYGERHGLSQKTLCPRKNNGTLTNPLSFVNPQSAKPWQRLSGEVINRYSKPWRAVHPVPGFISEPAG
jgi:hypothetical protein